MRIAFKFVALFFVPVSLVAVEWSTHGPTRGAVTEAAFSSAAPKTVYAAGGAGVFRSDDAGESWRNVSGPFNAVTHLAVDQTNANNILATAQQGVFKSADGGVSWHKVTKGLTASDPSALIMDPVTPSTVYLGSHCGPSIAFKTGTQAGGVAALDTSSSNPLAGAGAFKSVDGGESWTKIQGLLGAFVQCVEELSLDPAAPRHLFAVDVNGEPSESYDAGETWTRAAALVPGRAVAGHPVFTMSRFGVELLHPGNFLRSIDGGSSWTNVTTTGVPLVHFNDLSTDPATGRLFLATDAGIYRSGDSGSTWIEAGAPRIPTSRVVVDRAAGYVFAANALGLFRAPVTLGPWQQLTLADPSTNVRHVIADPHDPSTLYSLIFDFDSVFEPFADHGRIFLSRDGGSSWQLLRENDQLAFASAAADGAGDLYVYSGDNLWRYSSAAQEWTQLPKPPAYNLVAGRQRAGHIYAFDYTPRFAASDDGGQTWQSSSPPIQSLRAVAVDDSTQPSTIYAGGDRGISKSADNGMTWSMVSTEQAQLLAVAPSMPSRLYRIASAKIGIYSGITVLRSDDRGSSWTLLRWPDELVGAISMAVDPSNAQSLWVGSHAGRIFHTSDGGATWADSGFPVIAGELSIAADGSRLDVATNNFGVWDALISQQRRHPSKP